MIHHAILHHDIFTGDSAFTAIPVLPRFYADGVIAHVKGRIRKHDIFTGFDVDAVTVLRIPGIADCDVSDGEVFHHQGMDAPGRGILEGGAVKEHLSAVDDTDHHRPQKIPDGLKAGFCCQSGRYVHIG